MITVNALIAWLTLSGLLMGLIGGLVRFAVELDRLKQTLSQHIAGHAKLDAVPETLIRIEASLGENGRALQRLDNLPTELASLAQSVEDHHALEARQRSSDRAGVPDNRNV